MIDLRLGDCLEVLKTLEANSVDAVVTDPPAGISFMGKTWDKPGVLGVSGGKAMPVSAAFSRNPSCKNCHGRQRAGDATKACLCESPEWNDREHLHRDRSAFIDFMTIAMSEALRVAKPGARLLCWAIPRTSHWTGMAIEDAGWQIQDRITHVFGQGFPKHKSKLKPAAEDWWLATKPGPKWLGVDACRIPHVTINGGNLAENPHLRSHINGGNGGKIIATEKDRRVVIPDQVGRWPANFVLSHHDDCQQAGERTVRGDRRGDPGGKREGGFYSTGSNSGDAKPNARVYGDETIDVWDCHPDCPVRLLDEQSGVSKGSSAKRNRSPRVDTTQYRNGGGRYSETSEYDDQGGASRFFYCAKASKSDRGGSNTHPTVKSTKLMRWLCRLVCPADGIILDPFMGSGSTGKAAVMEGFSFIGVEQDAGYHQIAGRRISEVESDIPLFA